MSIHNSRIFAENTLEMLESHTGMPLCPKSMSNKEESRTGNLMPKTLAIKRNVLRNTFMPKKHGQ
jgi:hypothetical protein